MPSLKHALLTAAALAFGATAAQADPVSGTVQFGYANVTGGGVTGHDWGGAGSLLVPLNGSGLAGFNVQGDVSYDAFNVAGFNNNTWTLSGEGFWRDNTGALGVTIEHDTGSATAHLTNYGAFGEFFAGNNFTIQGNAGWFNATGSTSGNYFGGGAKFYAMDNLSFGGRVDYAHFSGGGNVTNYGLGAEYLFSGMGCPLSVFGGYTATSISGGGPTIHTWNIGLKVFFGDAGNTTLVAHDRGSVVQNVGPLAATTVIRF